jgi:hypothetical protein
MSVFNNFDNFDFYNIKNTRTYSPRINISKTTISFNKKFIEEYYPNRPVIYFKIGFSKIENSIILIPAHSIDSDILKLQEHSSKKIFYINTKNFMKKKNIKLENNISNIKFKIIDLEFYEKGILLNLPSIKTKGLVSFNQKKLNE